MPNITPDSLISRNRTVLFTDLDTETIVMHVETGNYLHLENEGADIWRLLEEPKREDEIVDALIEEFDVSRGVCEQDVNKFLLQLVEFDLISVSDSKEADSGRD